ncbi:hypothetical protein [Parasegetibacter sp. NRK P23]|uniref:hypothetical protein n=1 Tax=Parasegetibacter sp. NRK P23 TaxID=2942999 RepID=UPI002043DF6E|nr:hypothetical protein [Parasegetibacter sp. NRK P23]MCM5528977.1 hypothetical protein [Parasegetibacter sp. NRK P23]
MIPYDDLDEFTESDIYDTSDLVLGGETGVSNTPLKALFNRTEYLRRRMGGIEDVKQITGSYTHDVADFGKAFVFSLMDNATFTLPDVALLRPGMLVPIITTYTAIKALTVQGAGQVINDGAGNVSQMYMHGSERLVLMAAVDHWEVYSAHGNFHNAGEIFGGMKVMRNTAVLNGSLFNRADMPRLRDFGLSLGTSIVSDTTWLSDPGGQPVYRGCFSSGNGSTTMRLPDQRGLFDRYLDLGRGIDFSRLHDAAGGFALDEFRQHNHTPTNDGNGTNYGLLGRSIPGAKKTPDGHDTTGGGTEPNVADAPKQMINAGGSETRPKNVGKYPLIRF